jgi:hypothetical protein
MPWAGRQAGKLIKRVVARHGDVRELLANCEAIAAYTGDNYLPLMWRFYRSHRSTLFRLARTLRLISTTQDTSVDALDLVLANEDRTSDLLPLNVDLNFASEQWKRTILVRTPKGTLLARRHFEVCVFAALAATLKSGDVAVDGSDAYADYRQQLLPWAECESQVVEYCDQVGLATPPRNSCTSSKVGSPKPRCALTRVSRPTVISRSPTTVSRCSSEAHAGSSIRTSFEQGIPIC